MTDALKNLMDGVRSGDREAVEGILKTARKLANAHDPGCFGATPLNHAVGRKDREMIDLLLEYGADINGVSDWWAGGFGVLPCPDESIADHLLERGYVMNAYAAAGMGWVDRLREVLDAEPDQVHRKFGDGQRPLHVAKSVEAIDLLVERGAELDARDVDHGATAAQYLIGKEELCSRLIEHGATPDIFLACRLGRLDLAEQVLEQDPDALDARIGEPPFHSPGSEGGHIYTYQIGATARPLFLAAHHGHRTLLEALLPQATPTQRLMLFAWEADSSAAKALVQAEPSLIGSLGLRDQGLVADAAWDRRSDAVALMMELGFPVDVPTVHDSTPLDRAAFHGFDEILEILLRHGASLESVNEFGGTPLDACLHGMRHGWRKDGDYLRSVRLLVDAGSRVDSRWIPSGREDVDRILA